MRKCQCRQMWNRICIMGFSQRPIRKFWTVNMYQYDDLVVDRRIAFIWNNLTLETHLLPFLDKSGPTTPTQCLTVTGEGTIYNTLNCTVKIQYNYVIWIPWGMTAVPRNWPITCPASLGSHTHKECFDHKGATHDGSKIWYFSKKKNIRKWVWYYEYFVIFKMAKADTGSQLKRYDVRIHLPHSGPVKFCEN